MCGPYWNGRASAGARLLKSIDYAVEKEFGKVKLAMADKLAYEMRAHAEASDRAQPLLTQLISALRTDELKLPVLPDSVSQVMRLISMPDVDIADLAAIVEMDPGLAIKTIGVANSAYYQGASPAASVHEALMRMGLRNARNIVAAVALRSSLFKVEGYELDAQAIWIHSLLTGLSTEALLKETPPWANMGFLLGLAHDIGRISILAFVAEIKERDSRGAGACPATIDEVSGFVHAQVGSFAIASWDFDEDFVEAIHHHHEPDAITDHRRVLAHALHTGDVLAHWVEDFALKGETDVDPHILALLEAFGVEASAANELIAQVQVRFEELSNLA